MSARAGAIELAQLAAEAAEPPASLPEVPHAPEEAEDDNARGPSVASAMVKLVLAAGEVFANRNGDAYMTAADTGETLKLESQGFRDWLLARYFHEHRKAGREGAVREAVSTLAGIARSTGERIDVHVRFASAGGEYYLDLAQAGNSLCVRLRAGGWEVLDAPPAAVRFVRPSTMQSLPVPRRGGDLGRLWLLVNVPEAMRPAVLAWLIECIRTDTPCPVLELIGEHGSAKSTTSRILRRLIDPNTADLRAAPASAQDLFVTGAGVGIVTMENVSHLSPGLQDGCCTLATGGGFATRRLYTNDEEAVIALKRPVLINGIAAVVTAQDLVDRTVSVELPRVPERIESAGIADAFEAAHADLLGGLLDLAAGALERLPAVRIPAHRRPRLIEYASLGCAVSEVMGGKGDDFLNAFATMRTQAIGRTIEASAVAMALVEWWQSGAEGQRHETTAGNLMRWLENKRPSGSDTWPRSPKGFADALRRLAPALREYGISLRTEGRSRVGVRWIVEPTPEAAL